MITKINKKLLTILIIISILATSIFLFQSNGDKTPITGNSILNTNNLNELQIKVSIPCPGHAGLINGELSKLKGIGSVDFNLPNIFKIKYDSNQVSEQDILNLNIFTEYPAKKI